jgi:hypothetical protein
LVTPFHQPFQGDGCDQDLALLIPPGINGVKGSFTLSKVTRLLLAFEKKICIFDLFQQLIKS